MNEQLKNAQAEVLSVSRKCNKLVNEANQKMETAKKLTNEAENLKKQQQNVIEKSAKKLNDKFKQQYLGIFYIICVYAVSVTIFTALKSERCTSDIQAFCATLQKGVLFYVRELSAFSMSLSDASTSIPQEIVKIIVYWLLYGIVWIVGIGVPLMLLFFGVKWLVGVYRNCCADEISILVILLSIAILVFGVELMPMNWLCLLLISQAVYMLVRWYIYGCQEARR